MTLNRWKVLACTLTVGVGGLAVFATPPSGDKGDAPKETPLIIPPLPAKPATPPNAADTLVPIIPVKAEEPVKPVKADEAPKPAKPGELEIDLPIPVIPPTLNFESVPVPKPSPMPANLPVFEPVAQPPHDPLVLPAGGEGPKPPVVPNDDKAPGRVKPPKNDIPPAPPTVTKEPPLVSGDSPVSPPAKPGTPTPPPPPPEATVPLPSGPLTPKPAPSITLEPPPPSAFQPLPPSTPPTITESNPKLPKPTTPRTTESAKLKMLLRLGDGQPRFEIRNTATTGLLLKVYGEKIALSSPSDARSTLAGVTAEGRVRFHAPGIEGTCEHLTILSGTGEVLLKGNIRMKAKSGKTWSEMTAETMVYQIGVSGLAAPNRPTVTPAKYIPE